MIIDFWNRLNLPLCRWAWDSLDVCMEVPLAMGPMYFFAGLPSPKPPTYVDDTT